MLHTNSMKIFVKNSLIFLILLIFFFTKDFFYGLINIKSNVNYENMYITSLEEEIENINVIKNNNIKSNYYYTKLFYQNPYYFNNYAMFLINDDTLINKNNYVFNNDGLIGIVDKVYNNFVIVKLLTNKDIYMQVKINDCYGILKYDDKFIVSNVDNYCNINISDTIYTSKLGYTNENIKVGNVKNIINNKNGFKDYEVNYSVNFNKVNYALIIGKE